MMSLRYPDTHCGADHLPQTLDANEYDAMTECIAKRELAYSVRGSGERLTLVIRIFEPFEVKEGTVSFKIDYGVAGCRWEIDGLPEELSDTVYGADSLQALQLASDVDGILQSLRKKYEFYFPSGEPYFQE